MVVFPPMAWIVGIDLRAERMGVLKFAAWWRRAGRGEKLIGVHVVENDEEPHDGEVVRRAEAALADAVRQLGFEDDFEELLVVEGRRVEDALQEMCVQKATQGLIVGRRVGRDERRLVRIGAVTRRILRALPAPVIVVPPDLEPEVLGAGPVVLGVLATQHLSLVTYEFAQRAAEQLGRELVVVASAPPLRNATAYLTPALIQQRQQVKLEQTRQQLSAWMAANELKARLVVASGPPLEHILGHAEALGAPLVIAGRNKSGVMQRYLGGATSTDLVTHGRVPTAVVADFA